MDLQMVMQELEALGKERTEENVHIQWCARAAFWRGYRCYEANRQENKNQSTFG